MKKIRALLTILFLIVSCGAFAGYKMNMEKNNDTTPPVLTIPEEVLEVSIEATDEDLLVDVTAMDDVDGDLTSSVLVESVDKFNEDKTRTVTYVVVDAAGNVTKGTRDIKYTDYRAPRFSMSAPLYFFAGYDNITGSVEASDKMDGDISAKVKVSQAYRLQEKAGEYPMEFYVTNSLGDVSSFTATVTLYDSMSDLTDLTAPTIELEKYLVYGSSKKKVNTWDLITSIKVNNYTYTKEGDVLVPDMEISQNSNLPQTIDKDSVRVKGKVDYKTPGTYELTYSYTFEEHTGKVRLVVIVL